MSKGYECDEGTGWCPECFAVVAVEVEDNSHGCHTVYDYSDRCGICGMTVETHEPFGEDE